MSNSLYDLTCSCFNSDVYLDYAVSNIHGFLSGLGGVEIFFSVVQTGTFTTPPQSATGSPFVGLIRRRYEQ